MYQLFRTDYDYLYGDLSISGAVNDFTGSAKVNSKAVGAFRPEFKYRVRLVSEDKKPVRINAGWYVGVYIFDLTKTEDITEKDFDVTEDGVTAAFDWLQSEYERVCDIEY